MLHDNLLLTRWTRCAGWASWHNKKMIHISFLIFQQNAVFSHFLSGQYIHIPIPYKAAHGLKHSCFFLSGTADSNCGIWIFNSIIGVFLQLTFFALFLHLFFIPPSSSPSFYHSPSSHNHLPVLPERVFQPASR